MSEPITDEEWRRRREERLREPYGWLSITALEWLPEGDTPIGSREGLALRIPGGPELAGRFRRDGARVHFIPEPGVPPALVVNGSLATAPLEIRPDRDDGKGDRVDAGPVRIEVIERTAGLGVRLRDPASERRRRFPGLAWYPISENWRIDARWERAAHGAVTEVENALGGVERWSTAGEAVLELQGAERRLLGFVSGDQILFVFKDLTNGRTTYGPGRFLYATLPAPGETIELNFNRAYHPPCAFNPFTTCPLAPPQNRLDFDLEGGEKINYSN